MGMASPHGGTHQGDPLVRSNDPVHRTRGPKLMMRAPGIRPLYRPILFHTHTLDQHIEIVTLQFM